MNWSFERFSLWLISKAECFRKNGMKVELQEQNELRSSIRLRVESSDRLGELVVWAEGNVHELVVDLGTGDFMYERDGFQLDENWISQLEFFFKHFDSSRL